MPALKEFANFIILNMATLAETYAQLLEESGGGYEVFPAVQRTASGRRLLRAVIEAYESETADTLCRLFDGDAANEDPRRWAKDIDPPYPLLEVECLGQTLVPVVTNLEASKFLWQILSELRATVLQSMGKLPPISASVPTVPVAAPPIAPGDGAQKVESPDRTADRLRIDEPSVEEHNLLRTLIDNMPDYIYVKDTESRFIVGNAATARIMGAKTPDELVGKTDSDFYPEDLAAQYYADEQAIIQSGRSLIDHEEPIVDPDGNRIWVSTTKVPLRNSQGKIVGVVGIGRDITQHKQAGKALAEERNLLHTLIDNIPDCHIFIKDTESQFLITNSAHLQTLGAETLEEVIGKTDFDLFPQELAEQYYADEQAVIQSGQPLFNRVELVIDQAGRRRWYLTNKVPLRDRDDSVVGLVGISLDITERRELEQQVQESLERRSRQVQLSTQVARVIAAVTGLDDLYRLVVAQVNELSGYYHTQLLRYDPAGDAVELVVGYGKAGEQMLAADYRVPAGTGLIGLAAVTGTSVLRSDVTIDPNWSPNPFLPATKSELAVPIKLGGEDVNVQVMALKSFISGGFDGFALAAIDPAVIAPVAKEALDKGMSVVTCTSNLGEENQTAIVWAVEYDIGYMLGSQAGEWAKKYIPAGESLKLGVLNYRILPQVIERERGIIEGIKAVFGPNIEIVGNETIIGGPRSGLLTAEKWLQSRPDLNMIVSINDNGALGAYQAIIAAGKDKPDTFFVGGIDAVDEALVAIKKGGAYQATVDQPSREMGRLAVRTLLAAIKGMPYEKVNTIKCTPVNPANIDEFLETGRQAMMVDQEAAAEDILASMDLSDIKIGLSVLTLNNPFFAALVDNAKKEAERLGVELVVNDPRQVLGVLDVQSDVAGLLNVEDQQVLEGLCDQIAVAIDSHRAEVERKRVEETLAKRATELETVAQLSATISTILETQKLLQTVVDLTKERFGLYHAHIYLLNEAGDILDLAAGAGEIGRQMVTEGWHIPLRQEQSLVARAARTQQGVIVNNVREEPGWLPNPLLPDTRSELAVPLIVGERILGVLDVQADTVNHFTPEDVHIQTTLATQVAVALQNAALYRQTQDALEETLVLPQFSQALVGTLSVDKILDIFFEGCTKEIGFEYVQLMLVDENQHRIKAIAGVGISESDLRKANYSLDSDNLVTDIIRTGQTEIITDWDERLDREIFETEGHTDWVRVFAPVILRQEHIGVVEVGFNKKVQTTIRASQIRLLGAFIDQTALALDNAQRYEASQRAARREQTIRQITEKMRAATTLDELVKVTAEELGERLSAGHTGVELGV